MQAVPCSSSVTYVLSAAQANAAVTPLTFTLLLDPPLLLSAVCFHFEKWKPGKQVMYSATWEALSDNVRRRTEGEGVFPDVRMDQAQKRLWVMVASIMSVHTSNSFSAFVAQCVRHNWYFKDGWNVCGWLYLPDGDVSELRLAFLPFFISSWVSNLTRANELFQIILLSALLNCHFSFCVNLGKEKKIVQNDFPKTLRIFFSW